MVNLKSIDKAWTLFLDRDGVINVRPVNDYVKIPAEFVFIDNVPQAIKSFNKIFKYTFVVTNQQGIGKGLMKIDALELIHKTMSDELKKVDAKIDEIFYCPNKREDNSVMRKPNVGMALAARKRFTDVNFKKSVMVGDSLTDMQFGKKLNMTTVFISPDLTDVKNNSRLIDYHFVTLYDFAQRLNGL